MNLQPIRKAKLPGRNERCPCGSGKKAKKCCLPSIKVFAALPQHIREQIVVGRILSRPGLVVRPADPALPIVPSRTPF